MSRHIGFLLFLIFSGTVSYSQEGLQAINGTQLYFKTFGSGEPLLVIHGGPGLNHTYFLPHLEKLSQDFKVILYDQRASGLSLTPSADSLSLKYFVDDIEAIRNNLGVEKINILAHSWGALLAIAYAKDYRHRVKKMVLCNPVALSKEYDHETFANQQKEITGRDSTDRSIIMGSPRFKAGKADAYRNLMMLSFRHSFHDAHNYLKLRLELPANYVSASKALYTGLGKDLMNYNYYEDLKVFEFPVLILRGETEATPLAAITKIHSNIPKATLQIFNKSGHFIFIEEPRKFRREVVSFLIEK